MMRELVENESAVRQPYKHLCRAVQPHTVGQRLDVGLYEIDAERFELLAQGRFALGSQLLPVLLQRRPNFGTGRSRGHHVDPILLRLLPRSQDFHLVAALQHTANGNQLLVDLGTNALLADLRMDAEGEVEGSRTLTKHNQVAVGREDINLLVEQIQFQLVDELQGAVLSPSMTSRIWPIHWSRRLSAR